MALVQAAPIDAIPSGRGFVKRCGIEQCGALDRADEMKALFGLGVGNELSKDFLEGAGHFIQEHAPEACVQAILDLRKRRGVSSGVTSGHWG